MRRSTKVPESTFRGRTHAVTKLLVLGALAGAAFMAMVGMGVAGIVAGAYFSAATALVLVAVVVLLWAILTELERRPME